MEQSGQIFVPVDPDLRARIEQAAETEHRTVAGQVRHWIAAVLTSREATRRLSDDHRPPAASPVLSFGPAGMLPRCAQLGAYDAGMGALGRRFSLPDARRAVVLD